MSLESIENNNSVIPLPPGIRQDKKKIPKKYEDRDILSLLSEEQLSSIERGAFKRVRSKENLEKKRIYEISLLQLSGMVPPPPQYYTILGELIKNPKAYAKTGAPMYNSPKYKFIDLNQKTYIYKLYLVKDKVYIGKTTNIKRRIEEHFSGGGSKVTQKFKPINYEILEVCDGFFSDEIEQYHTKEHIKIYGYENVRGGKYTNSKTLV
tara:strand:- start:3301 stop:3924 length:624 start_codon:yes stop_codon:yes gene_type:complete